MLSVIVPVYQAVHTLERCVSSILWQNVDDMEIVLVDDGSTDGSSDLCDSLAMKNSNIIVKHIENSGTYQARRQGALVARGEKITFVDADDWIEKRAYSDLLEIYNKNKVDIILYSQQYGEDGKANLHCLHDGLYGKESIKREIIPSMIWDLKKGRGIIEPSLCSKIIKKELYLAVTNDVTERILWGEDAAVTYPMLCAADNIYIYNRALYHYCVTSGSSTQNYPISRIEELRSFRKVLEQKLSLFSDVDFGNQIDCYMRMFLDMLSVGWFGCRRSSQLYTFPFDRLKRGCRIKLYGAGDVGKSYYQTILQTEYVKCTGWFDKNALKIKKIYGEPIKPLDKLQLDMGEYVLIAVKYKNTFDSIKRDLLNIGISEESVIWEEPILIG